MFGVGGKAIVGLDVGSHAVKAVALQANKDRITLQGYAQARIGSQDPATVVRQVIDELGVKPKRLVTSVSGRSVIVRQVETPKLGQEELKQHITYEADKYIPFGTDEVIIDCQPLPDRPGAKAGTMQVLLVAVRRGFVEDHINLLKSAGIAPEIIDVDVFALANAYEALGPGAGANDQGATALIDIGASKSNIAIVQGDRLLFTREVYLAGNEITDAIVRTFNESADEIERLKLAPGETLEALVDAAMPAFEDLANEIRLSFDYVEGQFDQQVSTVVLSGCSSQLPTVADILGNILGRPVQVFDPLAGLDLVPSRYDLHGLDANSPGLTIALGLAVHALGSDFNGLGGNQSHGWQPRHDGATGGHQAIAIADQQVDDQPAPSAYTPTPAQAAAALAATAAAPLPMPMSAMTPSPLPPPATLTPPRAQSIAPMAPPPPPAPIPPPPAMAFDTDEARPGTASFANEDADQSGLLVVLDDDQDMPPSEAFRRTTTSRRKRPSISLDNFADEDDQGGMPQLPKL